MSARTMSLDRIETLRLMTRGYELSSRGTIGPSQFLRYLEHARWQTISHSSKIPIRKFWYLGVVRAQVLELHRELSFDVEIEISTWLSHVGRTSSSLSHDVVRVSDGKLVARSTATIVALDSDRRPQAISEGAKDFVTDRESIPVERFEAASGDGAWERAIDVRPSDQDLQQHVNHARYVDFVEDTRWFAARARAYGPGEWDGPARRVAIAYEKEARVFDPLSARTWRRDGTDLRLDFLLLAGPERAVARASVELAPPGGLSA